MEFMMISHKSEWTQVLPKDGAILSAVVATIYEEKVRAICALADVRDNWWSMNTNNSYVKGVNAMYDYIGQYSYYKTLPRSIAMDVIIAALTHLLPKKK